MRRIIDAAFIRSRAIALLLLTIIGYGLFAYGSIPKESTPDVPIPLVLVSTVMEGISPEDSEQLLVRPLETRLSAVTGLKKMTSDAGTGFASVQLEFMPGEDIDEALDRVREAVDRAQADLPDDATPPAVTEINTGLFPILTIVLSGTIPERSLSAIADDLAARIEAVNGVLEVDIGGQRDRVLEVQIDPVTLETYGITLDELIAKVSRNNTAVAAGIVEGDAGLFTLRLPGRIETAEDILDLPVKMRGGQVVRFEDVATALDTFRDPQTFARINGKSALVLEIKKRSGSNIIETIDQVKALVATVQPAWPDSVTTTYMQDESESVKSLLNDLEANVITAVILVMVVILWALGLRAALLVGISIPASFLAGVAGLYLIGSTMNLVVLFSLILVVGMLVDGVIVTTEQADRNLQSGQVARQAYANAAKTMAWPLISSTATTLCVFFPLLFWQGTVGEFMKYLPITVILTLSASLVVALIIIPVIGGLVGRAAPQTSRQKATLTAVENGDPRRLGGLSGSYATALGTAITHPWKTVVITLCILLSVSTAYVRHGNGVTFFPSVEPDFAMVQISARDNLSIFEKDALVRAVETRLMRYKEIASVYARTGSSNRDSADLIGTIQLELQEWDRRRPVAQIAEDIRAEMAGIPGIRIQVQTSSGGPSSGKPINLQVKGGSPDDQVMVIAEIRKGMDQIGGFTDISDTRPLPGLEWSLAVDRSEASRYGLDVATLGQIVQLVTRGIKIAEYLPDAADEPVDIRVRFPASYRSLDDLKGLRIPTQNGSVPITNFVTFNPVDRSGTIIRIDQKRVMSIEANVAPGVLVNDQVNALKALVMDGSLPAGIEIAFAGEAEDQQASMTFLAGAFVSALVLMFTILLIQFNSFYQSAVVMSSIVLSIGGVLFGLLVTGQPFGIVMGGIGIIALAGIVVNNNIVLIDTFNALRKKGLDAREAALRTGTMRMRPVLLTSATTVFGLMPMVLALNINFFTREIVHGAPSTQWWVELSSAIAGGLTVATFLTLLVTPALLVLGERSRRLK